MSTLKLLLQQFAVILSCCEAYKVLVISPVPARSHAILGDGIVRHLANAGHQVTYASPFTYDPASPNVRMVDFSDFIQRFPIENITSIDVVMKNGGNPMPSPIILFTIVQELTTNTYGHKNLQKLMNDPEENFDVVIVESTINALGSGLAAVFNCPLVWSSTVDIHWGVQRLIDEPTNPAYTANAVSSAIPPFTFWERVKELFLQLTVMLFKNTIFDVLERRAYDELIAPSIIKRGRQPPNYYDVKYNASLLLVNAHPSLSIAKNMPQNAIHIGGYHIDEDVKPLPEDLKKIMDNSKDGVIYFSMGSILKSTQFPKELKDSILQMFGDLKQTVFWKFEEDLPNKPKNVHILKWAPQQSILSHPNTVVFITHGGLLSTTETVHFGKPIIGIPVFGDQIINVQSAVKRGFARKVDLSYTMAGEMKKAIGEVFNDPRYAAKAKELSLIYHDRPVTPGKALVHWVNHVVKTRGAAHLRSPALKVPFYQKLYLDLFAVILVILYVSLVVFKRISSIFRAKKKQESQKKNN